MKDLDEVIRTLEICCKPDVERNCKDCNYGGEECGMDEVMKDALSYLKEYKRLEDNIDKTMKIALNMIDKYEKIVNEYLAEMNKNDPLTWDELKEMEGKPVWVEHRLFKGWRLVGWQDRKNNMMVLVGPYSEQIPLFPDDRETNWQAYRKERDHADEAGTVSG